MMEGHHRREFLRGAFLAGAAAAGGRVLRASAQARAPLPRPKFYLGIGIENCWIAQADPKKDGDRRILDVFFQMQHYDKWKEDLDLLPQAGVNTIRYSVPWYKAEPKPGVYDWSWIDKPVEYLVNKLKIIPIMDLIHYGTPRWMPDGLIDARFPEAIGKYAGAMAAHFKGMVNHYSPHNEPQVTSIACGFWGSWPPYLKSADGWAKIGVAVAKGMALETQAIREAIPNSVIISVDPFFYARVEPILPFGTLADPWYRELRRAAACYPACLAYGKINAEHPLGRFLLDHRVAASDLDWFGKHAAPPDIHGYNFYPDGLVFRDFGDFTLRGSVPPERAAREAALCTKLGLLDAHSYFKLPIYLTETSAGLTTEAKVAYIHALHDIVEELRREKVPIVGVNWWPLFNTIQWDYRERSAKPLADFIYPGGWNNGLCLTEAQPNGDLKRIPTSALAAYREVISRDLGSFGQGKGA